MIKVIVVDRTIRKSPIKRFLNFVKNTKAKALDSNPTKQFLESKAKALALF